MTHRSRPRQRRGASPAVPILVVLVLLVVGVVIGLVLRGVGAGTGSGTAPSLPAASAQLDPELLEGRMTVLVLGTDLNAEREASGEPRNTDAIMLVSFAPEASELALLGLPRDTVDVPMGDGSTWSGKVNAIERERGLEAMVGAMEATFGTTIDHHVQIDMDDLVTLVDAVGGVEVDVETQLSDPPIGLDLAPGVQRLDGETALDFVRTRQDSDYARAERHQQLLLALVAELVEPSARIDLAGLVAGLDSLETDLPLDELPTLVELARRSREATVTREVVGPPEMIVAEGDAGDGRGYILQPDVAAIQRWVDEHVDGATEG